MKDCHKEKRGVMRRDGSAPRGIQEFGSDTELSPTSEEAKHAGVVRFY